VLLYVGMREWENITTTKGEDKDEDEDEDEGLR
jgi:hypothetical protein